ncbi:MAG TPA: hypothetical protein VJL87_02315 [Bdellovibrionota bacterium]|nr:hypothetical protein [Bdellovibrionota bacterium]
MTNQESGKVWPCDHIQSQGYGLWEYKKRTQEIYVEDIFCSECGAIRPEEAKDGLDAILKNYFNSDVDISRIKKDLLDWRELAVQKTAEDSAEFYQKHHSFYTAPATVGKEEKPKAL